MSQEVIRLSEPEKVSMSEHWFQIAAPDHFWIQWRFKALLNLINGHLDLKNKSLEIGCGSAVFINQLEHVTQKAIDGCDLDEVALRQSKDVKGRLYVYNIFDRNKELINQYQNIFLLDVLEHLDDPVSFLRTAKEHGQKGSFVIINVPAQQWMYSTYDRVVGHKMRYDKISMQQLIEQSDLELIEMRYWGLSLIPLVLLRTFFDRILKKSDKEVVFSGFKPPGKLSNKLLKGLMKSELFLTSKPFTGASLLALARIK
ncbi:MAG TPA: class I SAM-dependent methyltransferase [Bacteroidia bacterium]|nr:class I SAM-dependent methyltransferase [Bacteroidia bacterium]